MDEPQVPLSESPASRAAEALRELQARAQSVKAKRKDRLSELETSIARQIDTLADALDAQQAADAAAANSVDELRRELESLRAKLDGQDRELRKESDQLVELEQQLKARETAVVQRAAEFVQRDEELVQRQQQLDLREAALDRRDQAADSSESQLAADAQAAGERADKADAKCKELERERAKLTESIAQLEVEALQNLETQSQQDTEWQAEREELQATIAKHEAAVAEWQTRANASGSELEQETARLQAALEVSTEKQAAAEQAALVAKQAVAEAKQAVSVAEQTAAVAEQATSAATAERDELQQKFTLAHDDVQRFRARVVELEQELARRPAADQTDSTELVALRAERDALADRVESLEKQPAPPADVNSAQQLSDLQRRFELAVEDVRDLKNKNAQLDGKLAAAKSHTGSTSDAGGMDWESQKRRMLASLEDEGGEATAEPARQKERISIADTIKITDAVIAEKDEEINHLKKQLAESPALPSPQADDEARQAAVNELVENDEIIRQHRVKIAEHELETEEKLRAAELEISVDRAKIARQRVELEQLKTDLETTRKAMPAGVAAAAPQVPKKRWLSKLGLGDEQ